eukprot:TRINITY_DN13419_c0_g2_i1.p1 TRINITY_DN13419_c0_g2~~TRINITY_DN13419_c0_g2_i1.p1  ORF type:complete len:285 (-),score=41.99 TRINITY_DN13419_c0_g2_i1:86-940(-)
MADLYEDQHRLQSKLRPPGVRVEEDIEGVEVVYVVGLVLFAVFLIIYWLNIIKQNVDRHPPPGAQTKESGGYDRWAYIIWFSCSFLFFGYSYNVLAPQQPKTDKVSFVSLFNAILLAESIAAVGHLTPFTALQYFGYFASTISFHLIFLDYSSKDTDLSLGLHTATLLVTASLLLLTLLMKRYLPSEASPRATPPQCEYLCILFKLSGLLLVTGALAHAAWSRADQHCMVGVLGGVCGLVNFFWPNYVLTQEYQKVGRHLANCFMSVPFLYYGVWKLDGSLVSS